MRSSRLKYSIALRKVFPELKVEQIHKVRRTLTNRKKIRSIVIKMKSTSRSSKLDVLDCKRRIAIKKNQIIAAACRKCGT